MRDEERALRLFTVEYEWFIDEATLCTSRQTGRHHGQSNSDLVLHSLELRHRRFFCEGEVTAHADVRRKSNCVHFGSGVENAWSIRYPAVS